MLFSPAQCSHDKHCSTKTERREGAASDQVKASSLVGEIGMRWGRVNQSNGTSSGDWEESLQELGVGTHLSVQANPKCCWCSTRSTRRFHQGASFELVRGCR